MTSSGTPKIVAWSGAAVIATLAAGSIVLEIVGPAAPGAVADPEADSDGVVLVAIQAVVESAFAVLGAVVVSRQPRNPLGWLLMVVGLSFMTIGISTQVYLQIVLPTGDATGMAAYVLWLGNWSWLLRDQIDLQALSTDLRGVVLGTVPPTHVSLAMRDAT